MGCGSCSSSGGCGKGGGCKSGSCNRMNTYNWLSDLPISEYDEPFPLIEISFNHGSRKDFYNNPKKLLLEKGDMVVVEGSAGYDMGEVSLTGEIVKLQIKKKNAKVDAKSAPNVLRMPSTQELASFKANKAREKSVLIASRKIIKEMGLEMKLAEVEMQADGNKATFYYTAEGRVDFRELIKRFAIKFSLRVEMKQIGIRQEAAKVGGVGSCGRELCCSTWLTDFKSVNTGAARYQNLSINQLKLSGQCGRLKCCLNYELDTYMEALEAFPRHADKLRTVSGTAHLVKTDIFKNLMWYVYQNQTRHIPLSIDQVKEVLAINKKDELAADLIAVELEVSEEKKAETGAEYVDLVGQISLSSLERNAKKRRNKRRKSSSSSGRNNSNKRNANPKSRNNTRKNTQRSSPKKKNNNSRPSADNTNRNSRPSKNKNNNNRRKQNNPKSDPKA